MATSTIRTMDSIVLFLVFTFATAALITGISVLGYGILLEAALPVAALGGLSAGFLALFLNRLLDELSNRQRNSAASASERNRVPSFSSEIERAGRSITSG